MTTPTVIHWFRQDLRLTDNPALNAAAARGTVLPVYIWDAKTAGRYCPGATSRWWLHHSLQVLDRSLHGRLAVFAGDAESVLLSLVKQYSIAAVFWNRCYEPWQIERDSRLKQTLTKHGLDVRSFNGSLLWEPWSLAKRDGQPYRVFTPFYRKGCLQAPPPRNPLPQPSDLALAAIAQGTTRIDALGLTPRIPWDKSLRPHWTIGTAGAWQRLQSFLDNGLHDYQDGRQFPAQNAISRLSPHLHFGEISPHQVWERVRALPHDGNVDHFCSELGWREFSYNLLYFNPTLPERNLQSRFDRFPWIDDQAALQGWQQGQTGIPIVDAGMRELWQTGFMHNRVRMIVGSFLVKNLLLHWQHGERWFWDCLVDADLANNSAGWQWVAGCGADAAPYFRIFNPVLQAQKFDAAGIYTRRYVPELAELPDNYLFRPWEAPTEVLRTAGVVLGKTYPWPVVDLKTSRQRALDAFHAL